MLVSELVPFLTKMKSSLWISLKNFKTRERHSLVVCGSLWGEKQFLLIFVPFYWFDQKKFFFLNPNISQDLPLFKHGKKNKLSEYICVRFWDRHLLTKEKFYMNFSKNISKQQKGIVLQYVAHFGEKNSFC